MVLIALPGLANWIDQDTGLQAPLIKSALHLLHPAPETRLGGPKKHWERESIWEAAQNSVPRGKSSSLALCSVGLHL